MERSVRSRSPLSTRPQLSRYGLDEKIEGQILCSYACARIELPPAIVLCVLANEFEERVKSEFCTLLPLSRVGPGGNAQHALNSLAHTLHIRLRMSGHACVLFFLILNLNSRHHGS